MRKFVLRPEPQDQRDFVYRAKVSRTIPPPRVDLRNERMPPVWDQGSLGSCTAFAALALREYIFATNAVRGLKGWGLSKLYLYWHSRNLSNSADVDDGAYIRDVFKALHKRGVCPDDQWPYDQAKVFERPPERADRVAEAFRVTEYQRLLNLQDIKTALANDQPVVFGMQVYSSFMRGHNGYIPMPKPASESLYGAHAMLAVGYNDDLKYVIVRNSWGSAWGDKGYCYVPFNMFYWPTTFDFWTCKAEPKG